MVHIGIIPDGNRRWSKINGNVIDKIKKLINQLIINCNENNKLKYLNNITEISIYVLSEDNLIKRADNTFFMIEDLLNYIFLYLPENIYKQINIQFIGEIHKLPEKLKKICENVSNKCNKNSEFRINFAVCYNPEKDSLRILMSDKNRQKQSDIDLLIRTGFEKRISGFFPLKTLYSELFFADKLFPDFTLYDLDDIIGEYLKRERRFGA